MIPSVLANVVAVRGAGGGLHPELEYSIFVVVILRVRV